jgi:hypothetical protein
MAQDSSLNPGKTKSFKMGPVKFTRSDFYSSAIGKSAENSLMQLGLLFLRA